MLTKGNTVHRVDDSEEQPLSGAGARGGDKATQPDPAHQPETEAQGAP